MSVAEASILDRMLPVELGGEGASPADLAATAPGDGGMCVPEAPAPSACVAAAAPGPSTCALPR